MAHEDVTIELFYCPDRENCRIEPLKYIEKYSDNVAKYTGTFDLSGSGEQGYNIRIRPSDDFFFELYPEYVKWLVK